MKSLISGLTGLFLPIAVVYTTLFIAWSLFCFQCGDDDSGEVLFGVILGSLAVNLLLFVQKRFKLRPAEVIVGAILSFYLITIYL